MAFVVSEGKLMGLSRASAPRVSSISLAADFSADYATIWKTQPHVRTVVGFLARNIAQIGLHAFERTSDTDRKRLTDHPLAAVDRQAERADDALPADRRAGQRPRHLRRRLLGEG
jgi:hypothetical protein